MIAKRHLVDSTGKPLCPEWRLREEMDDAEFWDYVLNGNRFADGDDEVYDPSHAALDEALEDMGVCQHCGCVGACGWDSDGRPYFHAAA